MYIFYVSFRDKEKERENIMKKFYCIKFFIRSDPHFRILI